MDGPDSVPLSVADADLGAIKSIARGADSPYMRNVSQGLAAKAVAELEMAVQAAAKQGGPAAEQALRIGRGATRGKYAAADVLDQLRTEPVQVFNQATWAKDAGIARLRDVAKMAPQEMPKIGRAFLENLFETATAEGGFGRAQSLHTKWQNLGPETKALLYPNQALRGDLDKFFLLAKKMGENPNPSGSALVGSLVPQGYLLMTPAGVPMLLGGAALSSFLHSPRGVRLLTQGLQTPAKSAGGNALWRNIRLALPAGAAGINQSTSSPP